MDFLSVSECFLEMLGCKTEMDIALKGSKKPGNGAMLMYQTSAQKGLAGVGRKNWMNTAPRGGCVLLYNPGTETEH